MRQQRFDTIKKIAEIAADKAVDAVLVAGDVFDSNAVSDETLRRTLNAMHSFKGTWVLLAGNHDAAYAQSAWTRMRSLEIVPENVILATEPKPIELADGAFWVFPAPLQRRHEVRDLTDYFDAVETPDGALRIGLAHGSVTNRLPEKAESMNPVDDQRADSAKLDYLALGDWHGTLEIANRTWYSGTPEQDRFRQNEPGNVLIVQFEKSGEEPQVEVLGVGRFSWRKLEFQIDYSDSIKLLKQQLDALGAPANLLIDLRLQGVIDLEGRRQLEDLLEGARAQFHYLDVDDSQLRASPSPEDISAMGATGFLAATIEELVNIQDEPSHPDCAHAARALRILYFEQLALRDQGR